MRQTQGGEAPQKGIGRGQQAQANLAFRLPGLASLPKPVSQFDQLEQCKSGEEDVDFSFFRGVCCMPLTGPQLHSASSVSQC